MKLTKDFAALLAFGTGIIAMAIVVAYNLI